jgi:hypothetical protein
MLLGKIRIETILKLYKVMIGLMLDYRATKMNRSKSYLFFWRVVNYRRSAEFTIKI